MNSPPIDWLLETGDAWVRYRTRVDLLNQPESDPDVQADRAAMLADPRVEDMIDALQDWPGPPLTSHKKSGHHLHLLSFLAEIGVRAHDPGMRPVVERILKRQAPEGAFRIAIQVSESYGGSGEAVLSWMLCDAPVVYYALCTMGLKDDPRVEKGIEFLRAVIRENGWPCITGPELTLRGPGRKSDPCPYANLVSLKALAAYGPERPEVNGMARTGVETLLRHWENQTGRKLYLFGIGTDFRKPKLPLVWYDILHVGDVLSRFPAAHGDARFHAMMSELMVQSDLEGRFTAASMYQDWREWDFANKKKPSPGITLIAWRAAERLNGVFSQADSR